MRNARKDLQMSKGNGQQRENMKSGSLDGSKQTGHSSDLEKSLKDLRKQLLNLTIVNDTLMMQHTAKNISLGTFSAFIRFVLKDVDSETRKIYEQRLDEIGDAMWKEFEYKYKEKYKIV